MSCWVLDALHTTQTARTVKALVFLDTAAQEMRRLISFLHCQKVGQLGGGGGQQGVPDHPSHHIRTSVCVCWQDERGLPALVPSLYPNCRQNIGAVNYEWNPEGSIGGEGTKTLASFFSAVSFLLSHREIEKLCHFLYKLFPIFPPSHTNHSCSFITQHWFFVFFRVLKVANEKKEQCIPTNVPAFCVLNKKSKQTLPGSFIT